MTAPEYIRQLYPDPEERMANVLIPLAEADGGERPKVEQRVWPARTAMSAGVQAWMRHLNARRYDVFVGMNPLRPQARRRFKRDVQAVARVYLDLDNDGPGAVRRAGRFNVQDRGLDWAGWWDRFGIWPMGTLLVRLVRTAQ